VESNSIPFGRHGEDVKEEDDDHSEYLFANIFSFNQLI